MRPTLFAAAVALITTSTPLAAQGFALGGLVGSTGAGGSLTVGLNSKLNLRGSVGVVPIDVEIEAEEIDFDVDFPTIFRTTADFYPTGGGFFLSAGAVFFSGGGAIDVTGTYTGIEEIGNNDYDAADVGELLGAFTLRDVQPYAGIGFGNPIGRSVGVMVDLGVGFGEEPQVALDANGPIANDPGFLADLELEEEEIRDDIPELLRFYPVLSISLTIGIGN